MNYPIKDLIKAVKIEAEERRNIAAHSGSLSDNGAGSLLQQVKFYEMGMNNVYPADWERFAKHIDPEYEEYLRLKKKFKS